MEKYQWLPNSWVNVECPTPEDIHYLTNQFNVPESFLSDIADTDERPRIEYEGNWLLTIIRIPVQSQEQGIPFTTIPLGIMTNNEIIISVCYYKTELIPDFIRYTRRKEVVVRHKYDLILRLIHSSAVWFLKYLKQINNEVAHAEKALEKSIRNEDLLRLMKLEKSMVYFNTSIRGNEVMLTKLQSIFQEPVYMDNELVEDVETELKQAHLTVNIYSDILTGYDGRIRLHHFQQREHHHEAHDLYLHNPDGSHPHRQLLRYERPDLRREHAARFRHHHHDLHHTISFTFFIFRKIKWF